MHQESIEPFKCLELRTDMVMVSVQAVVVVVPPAQPAVVAHTRAVVQVARNCRQAGSREILR